MLDMIELGRFYVEEHPPAPHSRLSCNHLLLLRWSGPRWSGTPRAKFLRTVMVAAD